MFLLLCCVAAAAMRLSSAQSCVCVMTDGGDLNVRSGPSTGSSIVGTAAINNCMEYVSSSGDWHQVKFQGGNAYVASWLVSPVHPCATSRSHQRCANQLCSSFSTNQGRTCDAYGCGHYGAPRGSRSHAGADVQCRMNDVVYAPYTGTYLYAVPPYGDGSCCDKGWLFRVEQPWINSKGQSYQYEIMGFYSEATVAPGTRVTKGQPLAVHRGLHCGCYATSMTDHLHFQIYDGPGSSDISDSTSYAYCSTL